MSLFSLNDIHHKHMHVPHTHTCRHTEITHTHTRTCTCTSSWFFKMFETALSKVSSEDQPSALREKLASSLSKGKLSDGGSLSVKKLLIECNTVQYICTCNYMEIFRLHRHVLLRKNALMLEYMYFLCKPYMYILIHLNA